MKPNIFKVLPATVAVVVLAGCYNNQPPKSAEEKAQAEAQYLQEQDQQARIADEQRQVERTREMESEQRRREQQNPRAAAPRPARPAVTMPDISVPSVSVPATGGILR